MRLDEMALPPLGDEEGVVSPADVVPPRGPGSAVDPAVLGQIPRMVRIQEVGVPERRRVLDPLDGLEEPVEVAAPVVGDLGQEPVDDVEPAAVRSTNPPQPWSIGGRDSEIASGVTRCP